jgi:hypothetical protein
MLACFEQVLFTLDDRPIGSAQGRMDIVYETKRLRKYVDYPSRSFPNGNAEPIVRSNRVAEKNRL